MNTDKEIGKHWVSRHQTGRGPGSNGEEIGISHSVQINLSFNGFPSTFYGPKTLLKGCA